MTPCLHCLSRRAQPGSKYCKRCDTVLVAVIERVKAMLKPQVNYGEYIQSAAWRRKADSAKRRAGYKCQVCGSVERLEVHHNCYDRLGRERNTDIVCLCRRCHQAYHRIIGT